MTNLRTLDENYNADLLDAMADRANELEEAMRESDHSEWALTEINGDSVGFSVNNSSEDEWEGYDDES
jgi:hypothetical protein